MSVDYLLGSAGGVFFVAAAILFLAYTLFGLTGFGQTVIAMPLLAQILPLKFCVPLVLLFDAVFSIWAAVKFRREANYKELLILLPFLAIGMVVGAKVLLIFHERALLLTLGTIIAAYGIYCLLKKGRHWTWSRPAAAPLGFVAGVIAATFGTGGPINVIYLSGRIDNKDILRASIATLLVLSVIMRVGILGMNGLFDNSTLWWWWFLLLPGCFAGVKLGNYLHGKLKGNYFLFAIHGTLIASGILLIAKNL